MSLLPLFCLSGFLINLASTSSAECTIVTYPRSIFKRGKRLEGFQFRASVSVPDAFRCARKCFFRRRCLSFNYNQNMTLCEFNNARVDPPYVILNASRDYLYSDIDDWHEVIGTGACQNRPCGICEACHPSATNYTCVKEELTSCRDIKICTNASSDGHYMVRPMMGTKPSLKVYCHQMNSTYPRDYLTLIHENFSKYPPIDEVSCDHIDWVTREPGVIFYHKIRLNLLTLGVLQDDRTFTNVSCDPSLFGLSSQVSPPNICTVKLPYGKAGDCLNDKCPSRKGMVKIDLRGTGLVVPPGVTWITVGNKKIIKTYRSPSNEVINITCGGTCAVCQPKERITLEPKF